MHIAVSDRSGAMTPALRELAERRLLFALSRFAAKVQRVTVTVADANGPRGGVDKSCRITVKLRRIPQVLVTDVEADLAKCISRAADRVGRAVARAVQRQQQFNRQPSATEHQAST